MSELVGRLLANAPLAIGVLLPPPVTLAPDMWVGARELARRARGRSQGRFYPFFLSGEVWLAPSLLALWRWLPGEHPSALGGHSPLTGAARGDKRLRSAALGLPGWGARLGPGVEV